MSKKKQLIICVDGHTMTGKTTLVKWLFEKLTTEDFIKESHLKIAWTKFPIDTMLSPDRMTQALHYLGEMQSILTQNHDVKSADVLICDRSYVSTSVYQSGMIDHVDDSILHFGQTIFEERGHLLHINTICSDLSRWDGVHNCLAPTAETKSAWLEAALKTNAVFHDTTPSNAIRSRASTYNVVMRRILDIDSGIVK